MSSSPEPTIRSIATVMKTLKGLLADNRLAEAVSLYSQCHDDVGWRLMNEVRGDLGMQRQCAMMFDRARDYKKAALLWGNLDDDQRAAELYERACDYFMAGEIYARVGQTERAAVMYEKYGSFQIAGDLYAEAENKGRAALNYERAGRPFLAGKLYYEAGQFQRAIELLQRIEDNNAQEYFPAVELIALTLVKTGAATRGIRLLQSVVEDLPIDAKTLPLYRRLAEFTDQFGDVEEAKTLYRDILTFEGDNKALKSRLEQLEESGVEAPTLTWDEPTMSGTGTIEHQVVGLLEDFDFLRDIALLEDLSLEEMRAFFALCHVARFREGQVLIEQGEPGRSMHILRRGEVVVQRVANGETIRLATLDPGDFVGEMALVDDAPTSAQVVATEETITFEIHKSDFEQLLLADDHIALRVYRGFVKTLTARLRKTTAQVS